MRPSPSPGPPAAALPEDGVAQVEYALTRLMRHANRPSWWRRLAAAGGISLERVEYAALVRIEEASAGGPVRLTHLADIMGLDISTVSRQVRALEQAGLVERSCDPADQRASRLRLTAGGQETLNRTRRVSQETLQRLLSSWTDRDRRLLAGLLGRLVDDMSALNGVEAGDGRGPEAPAAVRSGVAR